MCKLSLSISGNHSFVLNSMFVDKTIFDCKSPCAVRHQIIFVHLISESKHIYVIYIHIYIHIYIYICVCVPMNSHLISTRDNRAYKTSIILEMLFDANKKGH